MSTPERNARVLVVDNDPGVGPQVESILRRRGYEVVIARGTGTDLLQDAKQLATTCRPHVVVLDLRLMDEHTDERSGFELARAMDGAGLILYSAYHGPEVDSHAATLGIREFVGKEESPQRLIEAVERLARSHCAAQRESPALQFSPNWPPEKISHVLFDAAATTPPSSLVSDVLLHLFAEAAQVRLQDLGEAVHTPSPVTRGRSVVLKAWLDQRAEPLIVKLAPARSIEQEAANYRRYVEYNLGGGFHAQLLRAPALFWDVGALAYSFLGTRGQQLTSLTAAFNRYLDNEATEASVTKPIEHFFAEVWSNLYAKAGPERHPLFEAYQEVLSLDRRLRAFRNQEPRISFPGLSTYLPNPVPWILEHHQDSRIPQTRLAVTHGDLHGDNLFLHQDRAWAIDFERSGPGPLLRDFAELEVDVVTRLMVLPLPLFYELAVLLAEPGEPAHALQPRGTLSERADIGRALAFIGTIRRLAHEITRYEDLREYFWGMLLDASFVAALVRPEKAQRDQALLFGAVLCGRLAHWGRQWPPDDWPPVSWDS